MPKIYFLSLLLFATVKLNAQVAPVLKTISQLNLEDISYATIALNESSKYMLTSPFTRFTFQTRVVDFDGTKTISEILLENGIHDDLNSFAIIKTLNPTITDLDNPGNEINTIEIPFITTPSSENNGLIYFNISDAYSQVITGNVEQYEDLIKNNDFLDADPTVLKSLGIIKNKVIATSFSAQKSVLLDSVNSELISLGSQFPVNSVEAGLWSNKLFELAAYSRCGNRKLVRLIFNVKDTDENKELDNFLIYARYSYSKNDRYTFQSSNFTPNAEIFVCDLAYDFWGKKSDGTMTHIRDNIVIYERDNDRPFDLEVIKK